MKHISFSILLAAVLCLVGAKAQAYDIAVENVSGVIIWYNYINNATELEVTSKDFVDDYAGIVVIPEEVTYMDTTRKVTSIGMSAFAHCYSLSSVTIPNSVTSIGDGAFYQCTSLTSISIPNSVTSIGDRVFRNCNNLTSVMFGNSVTSIGEEAFRDCSHLTSVTFGNSVMNIGSYAFRGCKSMTSVTLPNSMTSIGDYAFFYCGLTSIMIPNSVTSIGGSAFSGCSGLTSVTIPNSVTSIGQYAFYGCSLTSVTIPNSVTSIGYMSFYGYDIPEVISKIEHPFSIETNTFSDNTFSNATLYVPAGTIDTYKATKGWKKFVVIEEEGAETPEPQQCATPTISYADGKIKLQCETEGAKCFCTVVAADTATEPVEVTSEGMPISRQYVITAYATAEGYTQSEPATLTITLGDGDLNGDGETNVSDVTKLVSIILGNQ